MRKLLIPLAAAFIVVASGGAANAAPGWGDDVNPGGGTEGLDCVYLLNANPPEYCVPQFTPERDITPPDHLVNPFTHIWHDIEGWF